MYRSYRILLLILFSILLVLPCSLYYCSASNGSSGTNALFISDPVSDNSIYFKEYDLLLSGLDRGGCTYFFLPSFIKLSSLDQSLSNKKLLNPDGSLLYAPSGHEQDVLVDTGDGVQIPWQVAFLRSENLCTLFLSSDSADTDSLTKDEYTPIAISAYSCDGASILNKKDSLIKIRGNATAGGPKKPFELRFDEDVTLCGMSPSKKWALLANCFEDTKLYNKMAFDTSERIGLEYAVESDWVDLYYNGTYLGNYLLCKEPDIGRNDLDIGNLEALNTPFFDQARWFNTDDLRGYDYNSSVSPLAGGYLFQKLNASYYQEKKCGFKVDDLYFSVKSPNNASREQMEYISSFVNRINDTILEGNSDQLTVIDEYSFARRYLIEVFFFNMEAFVNSYFFYKKPGIDMIYAGPVWDYDTCIGQGGYAYLDYNNNPLTQIVINESFRYPLNWDYILYENDAYRSYLIDTFRQNLPVFQKLIDEEIDLYAERTEASRQMDSIVWGRDWFSSQYKDNSSNIRYTRFFLAKRLEYLCEIWGIKNNFSYDFSNGSTHKLTFRYPDDSESSISVQDGTQLSPEALPGYDDSEYIGWCYNGAPNRPFSFFIPVYEDMTLELCPLTE